MQEAYTPGGIRILARQSFRGYLAFPSYLEEGGRRISARLRFDGG